MNEAIDPYAEIRRMASLAGDLRKELMDEGFTSEEAFTLIAQILKPRGLFG
jgi:hypothetical protein